MLDSIVPLVAIVCGLGFPFSLPLIWTVLNYRKRRRLMELHHAERMAAIERGMEIPPLPLEIIDGRSPRRRTSLLPGLVWFFIGLALLIGFSTFAGADPEFNVAGLIALGVGLAYLIYYFVEGRKIEARQLEHDLSVREEKLGIPQTGNGGLISTG